MWKHTQEYIFGFLLQYNAFLHLGQGSPNPGPQPAATNARMSAHKKTAQRRAQSEMRTNIPESTRENFIKTQVLLPMMGVDNYDIAKEIGP